MGRREIFDQNRPRKSYFRTSDVVFLVITTCIVSLNMALLLFFGVFQTDSFGTSPTNSQALNNFINEYNTIKKNYYGEINEEELMRAALEGLINALPDDNSNSIDSNQSNKYDTYLRGYFEGVGIEILNNEEGNIVIYSVIGNSPASKAGIQEGDIVKMVNGIDFTSSGTSKLVDLIAANSGAFTFVLERDGTEVNVTLRKATIELKSVSAEVINVDGKKIGYMDVSIFASNTDDQFKRELDKIEAIGIDGLVIDLRGNTGGYLSAVTNMISIFIDKKDVIYQVKDNSGTTKIYSDQPGVKIYEVVLLVDQASASASEIMAASLSEQLGSQIVGTKTYGKGSVQELVKSGSSQYKYTTKEWLTPKGKSIESIGVTPTIQVSLDMNYYTNPIRDNDSQLKAALDHFTK